MADDEDVRIEIRNHLLHVINRIIRDLEAGNLQNDCLDSYRPNRRTRASKSHAYNTCCSCSISLSLSEAVISEHLNLWKDLVLTERAQKGLGNSVTLFSNETPLSLGFEMLAVEQFDLKRNLLRLSAENLPVRFGLYY